MPIHQFTDEASGATIDVYVSANAPATEHQTQVLNGVTYRRVYSVPLASKDTSFGDCDRGDFARKTGDKRGLRVGDAWEISAEMSERRAQRDGVDGVREQFYSNYAKENGERHPDVVRKEKLDRANAKLGEWGIKLKGL